VNIPTLRKEEFWSSLPFQSLLFSFRTRSIPWALGSSVHAWLQQA
jgi:hypothetical protein